MKHGTPADKTDGSQLSNGLISQSREPVLGGLVQDLIGRSLRAHFDDIANAPVPDKFLALLAELEAKESGHDK
jgi:Anti-sigma factor NepR